MNFNIKNKRGSWINIIEAFIAILLIAGVFLVVLNKGYIGKSDISGKVYEFQVGVLREIQLNDALRGEIIGIYYDESTKTNTLPTGGFRLKTDSGIPDTATANTLTKINDRMLDYLQCIPKVCELDKICELKDAEFTTEEKALSEGKDIYAQAVAITTDASDINYAPRQLKLFCWAK